MPFNVFFRVEHHQPDPVIGTLFAWGSLAMGLGLLAAPPLAERMGKIQLVVITQALSIPFLVLLGFSPWFWLATVAYYIRVALMNMSGPVYQTFVMEHVESSSRATVASLVNYRQVSSGIRLSRAQHGANIYASLYQNIQKPAGLIINFLEETMRWDKLLWVQQEKTMFKEILKGSIALMATVVFSAFALSAHAWDHPSHMTTAAIAFAEIERTRPELIEKIGLVLLKHPDPSPFCVANGDARGKERARRMFIEAARWSDDTKWTIHDRPTWHSARWAIVEMDAPPEAKALAAARKGRPAGQAIEALVANYATLSSAETSPTERASALSWMLHLCDTTTPSSST